MNLRCPSCGTLYRVDPVKVPEAGTRARCTVCSHVMLVQRTAGTAAAQPTTAAAEPTAPGRPTTPARATQAPVGAPKAAPVAPRLAVPRPATPAAPPPARAPAHPAPNLRVSRPVTAPAPPPARPSAPVFRSAPGEPMPAPPVPPSPPARSEPRAPQAGGALATARPVNPFLAQDPRQKARRLARALVSDMIAYQPEKRQQALKEGTLKRVFEEEIKKSWEEYVEQVGPELANSTSYFTDALNEILAGGQNIF